MANDHLKIALTHAGLTAEQFADVVKVDPKTVQRWLSGRTPYARHRDAISRALDIPAHDLWPDTVPPPPPADFPHDGTTPAGPAGIRGWAYSHDDGAPSPIALLTESHQEVDLLDPTGALLFEPGVVAALQKLVDDGCQVRVITAGLIAGQSWPTACEQIGVRWITLLKMDEIITRLDDRMLLALPLRDDQSAPLFELRRDGAVDIFDRFAVHLDRLWDTAATIDPSTTSAQPDRPGVTTDRVDSSEPPRRWPQQLS